ncbi:hypothetical protein BHM03_00040361, partial [Ensete ventricosum]
MITLYTHAGVKARRWRGPLASSEQDDEASMHGITLFPRRDAWIVWLPAYGSLLGAGRRIKAC